MSFLLKIHFYYTKLGCEINMQLDLQKYNFGSQRYDYCFNTMGEFKNTTGDLMY